MANGGTVGWWISYKTWGKGKSGATAAREKVGREKLGSFRVDSTNILYYNLPSSR